MGTIMRNTRRTPIRQIICGVFEFVGLIICIARTRQENGIIGLAAGERHTMDAIDHHILPLAMFDELLPLL